MGFDDPDARAATPRRARTAPSGTSDDPAARGPRSPSAAPADPAAGDPAARRAAEDYLDWRDNLRRPPEDLRRVDAFFLVLFVLAALVLAAIIAGALWFFASRPA